MQCLLAGNVNNSPKLSISSNENNAFEVKISLDIDIAYCVLPGCSEELFGTLVEALRAEQGYVFMSTAEEAEYRQLVRWAVASGLIAA